MVLIINIQRLLLRGREYHLAMEDNWPNMSCLIDIKQSTMLNWITEYILSIYLSIYLFFFLLIRWTKFNAVTKSWAPPSLTVWLKYHASPHELSCFNQIKFNQSSKTCDIWLFKSWLVTLLCQSMYESCQRQRGWGGWVKRASKEKSVDQTVLNTLTWSCFGSNIC